MTAASIEDALHKAPFSPFDLHVDNGRVIHVRQPNCILFNESKKTIVVVEGERFHLVDVDHISSLSFASAR